MNTKLFKKLNERVETTSIYNSIETMTEAEIKEAERQLIFENSVKNNIDVINFVESSNLETEK